MENIKLACDAASAIACALLEKKEGTFNIVVFRHYVETNFPSEVAVHLITLVNQIE